ncbi:hypothetical protein MA16_Dca001544 [Dendrobium catenatum]|uniref:Uncharacterized protein n=1 Tax=Dendrobium catenatum TaxID=906689 RepID=A0A2I0WMR5_9ASPA|nr:hypothetical protein MA16_Dca001544 [Dendrobium catenatum]
MSGIPLRFLREEELKHFRFRATGTYNSCPRIASSGYLSKNDDLRVLLPRSDLGSNVETLLPLKPRLVERTGSKVLLLWTAVSLLYLYWFGLGLLANSSITLGLLANSSSSYQKAIPNILLIIPGAMGKE